MTSQRISSRTVLAGLGALLVVAFAAAFVIGREAADDDVVVAGPDTESPPKDVPSPPPIPEDGTEPTSGPIPPYGGVGEQNPPGPDVTPEPGATPDTTLSWWFVPYENLDRQQPIKRLTLNGITVGPDVGRIQAPCPGIMAWPDVEAVRSSRIGIDPDAIPVGATLEDQPYPAATCDGEGIISSIRFTMKPDHEAGFFGAWVLIVRWIGEPFEKLEIPAYRWSEGIVGGQKAAIARPILPELGLGQSAIMAYHDGVVTKIQAYGLPLDQLLQIAEEVLR